MSRRNTKPPAAQSSSAASGSSSAAGASASTAPRRFVRVERPTYAEDIRNARAHNSPYLAESNAAIKRARANDKAKDFAAQNMPGAAAQQRSAAAKFTDIIRRAHVGTQLQKNALMKTHATSSASSPYLSGTPEFTTGNNSQLTFMAANLKRGEDQTVTIHNTTRAAQNPHNSREQELLLAGGEKLDERVGVLHVKPSADRKTVRPMFIDKTGDKPRLFVGPGAVRRFKELSQG